MLLGFLSGLALGLFFHREDWLGGYASFRRRLYRLAHISCFGLGAVNLFFFLTVDRLAAPGPAAALASWMFIVGAITMPLCCVIMAHLPRTRMLFAIPVLASIAGAISTLLEILKS